MCCLTTSLTPLLWICDMSGLTISPISLLCNCLPIVVWLQAHRHYCQFVPQVLSDYKHITTAVSVPQVLSDYKHITTVVSLCHRCCLTTSTSPLLWVCATGVVRLQAHRHCCEFVPQVLSDYKHNTTAVNLWRMCGVTISPISLLCIRLPIVVWPLLWVRSQSVVQPTLCPTPLLKVHT